MGEVRERKGQGEGGLEDLGFLVGDRLGLFDSMVRMQMQPPVLGRLFRVRLTRGLGGRMMGWGSCWLADDIYYSSKRLWMSLSQFRGLWAVSCYGYGFCLDVTRGLQAG